MRFRAFVAAALAAAMTVEPSLAAAAAAAKRRPAPAPSGPVGPSPWRADLADPVLAALLREADQQAFDVRLAVTRLERAGAVIDLTRAGRRPHVDIGAEAAVGGDNVSTARSGLGAPVVASLEVDLFGALARGVDAAVAERTASAEDVAAARLLIGAEVTRAYLDLRAAQARRALLIGREGLALRMQGVLATRQAEGRATPAEAAAGASAVDASAEQARAAQTAVDRQLSRLGQLLGRAEPIAEPAWSSAARTSAPSLVTLSSEAVLNRPDVLAAAARLTAADARRAQAAASTRPRFTLTAALGAGDPSLLYLLDVRTLAWAAVGGLTHAILDGGAAKARVRGAEADAAGAEIAYRGAVAQAWGEARLGLAALSDTAVASRRAAVEAETAQAALKAGDLRRQAGFADGATVVALGQAASAAEARLIEARTAEAAAYVDVVLACGGAPS